MHVRRRCKAAFATVEAILAGAQCYKRSRIDCDFIADPRTVQTPAKRLLSSILFGASGVEGDTRAETLIQRQAAVFKVRLGPSGNSASTFGPGYRTEKPA